MQRERTFHADAVGHTAHGEGLPGRAVAAGDDHALERLKALARSLDDLHEYAKDVYKRQPEDRFTSTRTPNPSTPLRAQLFTVASTGALPFLLSLIHIYVITDALRIVFDGTTRNEPLISTFILKSGMAVNILSADMHRIGGKAFGQMLLELPHSYADREKLANGLREMGLTVEEVHNQ